MDAAPIMAHVNPLKKLREVLTTCGRGRSAYGQRNEARPKQWLARSLPLTTVYKLQGSLLRDIAMLPSKKKNTCQSFGVFNFLSF